MFPEGWKVLSLGEICSGKLQTGPFGNQLHANEYTETGVPVLMPKDLRNCKANINSAAKIPLKRAEELEKHRLREGDLIFSRRGDVARFALIDTESEESICGTGCLKATPNKQHSSLFLSYFLQKNAVKKWLEQNAVGQTMPNMNTAILFELPLLAASSKDEEDRIAKILQTWDRAITTTEKLIDASKQQKKALMQQLLTGEKRFAGFEEDWSEVKLSTLCDVRRGASPRPIADKKWFAQHGRGWIRIADVTAQKGQHLISTKQYLSELGMNNSVCVNPGDLIMSICGTIGVPKFLGIKACIHDGFVVFRNLNKLLCLEFLYHHLLFIADRLTAGGQPGTQKNLNTGIVGDIKYPTISVEEQLKIARTLTSADLEIDQLATRLTHLKQEKKALMQQLLTGKRRVKIDG